jgi:hypothetical protein|tara:strand:- start:366 stop:740 length:375 start_codon:yes stop_codon:yes gene_type:complete
MAKDFMEDFDSEKSYGFMAVNEEELKNLLGDKTAPATPEEITLIKDKLEMILQMNATCDGANAVKSQYDVLLKAKMSEVEALVMPLLINLKKNGEKDYMYWPGEQRVTQCDLQIERILSVTKSN